MAAEERVTERGSRTVVRWLRGALIGPLRFFRLQASPVAGDVVRYLDAAS
jgi:hypothetical protein